MVANKSKPARPSADEVMEQLGEQAPHLVEHCYNDRDWIWYCGPSLQKEEGDRTILKALGFRWAKGGHTMPDGETIGSWGHSCQRPMFTKRKHSHSTPSRGAVLVIDEDFAALGM